VTLLKSLLSSYAKVLSGVEGIQHDDLKTTGNLYFEERVNQLEARFKGKHLWRHLLIVIWDELLVFVILGLFLSILAPVIAIALKQLFSLMDQATFDAELVWFTVAVSGLLILNLAVRWYQELRESRATLVIYQVMTRLLFRRLQQVDLKELRRDNKEALAYITSYAPQLTQVLYVVDFATTCVLIAVLVVTLFIWFGIASLGVLVTVALLTFILQRLIIIIGEIYHQYLLADHQRVSLVQSGLSELPLIKRQYLEPQILTAMAQARTNQVQILRKRAWWQAFNRMLEGNVVPLTSLALVGFALWSNQAITPANIFPLLFLIGLLMSAVENNLANIRVLRNTRGPSQDIEKLFTDYPLIGNNQASELQKGEIRLESNGQTYTIHRGERIAIIGQTGVGKTRLLLQLAGQPFADSKFSVKTSGTSVYVTRNQAIFDDTLAELITLWQRPVDLIAYEQALMQSGLIEDLAKHQDGDARELYHQDTNLSEGQIQRLSLAQAFYAHPDILLLDDVFAPLDPKLTQRVAHHIFKDDALTSTRILVTSRLEMAQYVDKLLLVGEDAITFIDPRDFSEQTQALSRQILGDALATKLQAQLQQPPLLAPDKVAVETSAARRYSFGNNMARVREDAFDETEKQDIHIRDFFTNVRAIFSSAIIGVLAVTMLLALSANILFVALIERWSDLQSQDTTLGITLAGLVILSMVATFARYSLSFYTPILPIDRLHRLFFQRLISGNDEMNRGKLVGRLTSDYSSLEMSVPNNSMTIVASVLEFIAYTGLLIIATPFSLFILLPFSFFAHRAYEQGKQVIVGASRLRASVRGPLLSFISPALGSEGYRLSTLLRHPIRNRFVHLADLDAKGSYWSLLGTLRVSLLIRSIGLVLFLAVLWSVSILLLTGNSMAFGLTPSLIIFLALTFSQRVANLINQLQQTDVLLTDLERLAELLDNSTLPPQKQATALDIPEAQAFYKSMLASEFQVSQRPNKVSLASVTYQYGEDKRLFSNISLEITSGQRIAIVGASGGGKTSLARLLAGVLKPQTGEVLIGKMQPHNRHEFTRNHILVLESNIPSLPISVRSFLDPFGQYSDEQLHQTYVRMGEDISNLTETLSASLDSLSLGQRQIVNFIRGALTQPWLTILDEATSGLDSHHERHLLENLWQENNAYVAILHRTDNLDLFDTVYRLDAGELMPTEVALMPA
jgi:ABC-type bacteriocin/lantibiotic exporter with double-glycine peptidase domain